MAASVEKLEEHGYSDFDVVVTEKYAGEKPLCGHPVRELREFSDRMDEVVILLAVMPPPYEEMIFCLKDQGFTNYRFIA